jgi:hypothetical protein
LGELGVFYVYYLCCRCNGFPVVARLALLEYLSLSLFYTHARVIAAECVLSFVLKYLDPLRVQPPIDAARQHLFDVLQPPSHVCWKSCQHTQLARRKSAIGFAKDISLGDDVEF